LTRPEACSEREVMASGMPVVGIGLVVGQSIVVCCVVDMRKK
jgi:hypothetical protein